MSAGSELTKLFVAVWYGLIWLLLLGAIAYLFARGRPLELTPLGVLLGTFAAFSILAVRAGTRLFACLVLTTLVVPFYMFDAYLRLSSRPEPPNRYGVKAKFVAELRGRGLAAYPSVTPAGFLWLWQRAGDTSGSPIVIEGREILPLAGISDVPTVYCQAEDMSMVTYRSDTFGFRNPSIAGQKAAPEFALLGDSFVQGYCVPGAFTYAEQLSVVGRSASYGMNGTSALTQLAIYREYVKALSPPHVVWFFYEGNDLSDHLGERSWPPLRAYADRGHLQNLVRLNESVSSAMKLFIDRQLGSIEVATITDDQIGGQQGRAILSEIVDFVLLRRARAALRQNIDLSEAEWRQINDIWREVVETQGRQGGQVTFVYIPARHRFLNPAPYHMIEQKVAALWSGLGADYVSLTEPLAATGNPLAYYQQDHVHFTEEGYRLTANAIVEHLRRPPHG